MPRSSRHKSHRSKRHSGDPSESEDEEYSREGRLREEEPAGGSGARVSRDSEPDKRRISYNLDENGELCGDIWKKRKERVEELVVSDRWISGEDVDGKKSRKDDSVGLQMDKSEKSRTLSSDSKYRSSRRYESSGEVDEDVAVKVDVLKRRSDRFEKDSIGQYKDLKESDRERGSERNREREGTGSQNKDSKERERERGSEWDREERDRKRGWEKDRERDMETKRVSHVQAEDMLCKKRSSKVVDNEDDTDSRKDSKAYERQVEDLIPNSDMERGLEKHIRMQLESEDKQLGDGRDKDDKKALARDDNKIRTYRDDRYEDGKIRVPADNLDRDKRQHGDKSRDGNSRECASGRYDSKYSRDDNSPVDGRYRKSNLHDSDQYESYVDDREPKYKESRGKKRSLEDNSDLGDLKFRSGKGLREETAKHAISNIKSEPHANYPRPDYRHSDKRDNNPRNSHWKTSASSSVSASKEYSRDPAKSSEERALSNAASKGRVTATGVREKVTEAWLEKARSTNDGDETAASTKYERAAKSDSRTSPGWLEEKSPSKSMRRFSERTGARHNHDTLGGHKGNSKDGSQGELVEKTIASESVQIEISNRERSPVGSGFNRSGRSFGASPRHLPPPSVRHGMDSASALGSFEDETGGQVGDRRPYSRNKRGGDHGFGWGQGNAWKGGGPSWPSPVANGFIPLPHGPPPAFHPGMPQFPGAPFFGVRPSMDLSQNGVPFHVHDIGESFSTHGRQFGWHNTVDQTCPPHMQAWDGNSATFRDEAHIYGRPDWEPNRHLISNRGWAMGADMWKPHNKESEFPPRPAVDESLVGQPGQKSGHELALPEAVGTKVSSEPLIADVETVVTLQKKLHRPSKTSGEEYANFAGYYLSRTDISPELVDIELYRKCILFCATDVTSSENTSTAHKCILNLKRSVALKMGSKNHIPGLPSLAAKDAIFEKAMTLYSKQNGKLKYKPKALTEISLEEKKAYPEDPNDQDMQEGSGNEKMLEAGNQATLPSVDSEVDSSDIMEAINTSADTIANNATTTMEHKSYSNSNAIIYSSGSQDSEMLMEDCSANVNRIHPPENTH